MATRRHRGVMSIERKVNSLHRVHVRSLLDFMGIPVGDQEDSIKKNKMLLVSMANRMPEEFERNFDLVVNHKLPEGVSSMGEVERAIEEAKVRSQKILTEHVKYLEQDYVLRVKEELDKYAAGHKAGFMTDAKKVIDDARKEFVTYQVKLGNQKPKQVKGPVPKQFKKLCQLVASRKNILMVGPSGCGKTHIAGVLADAMDMKFAAQSCSVGVSESNFVGWLLPIKGNGAFVHVSSEFVRIYEEGGIFLIDEMDNADPNLLVFLNMALANEGFYLPQRYEKPYVKKHPDFVAIAAANTYGGGADILYSSRNALDAATLDRFRIGTVKMDYDDAVEEALIQRPKLLAWGRGVRKIISKHSLAKLMSTRALIDAQDLINQHEWTSADIEESYFADWSAEELAMVRSDMDELREQLREVA